jgi:hypothetical protein
MMKNMLLAAFAAAALIACGGSSGDVGPQGPQGDVGPQGPGAPGPTAGFQGFELDDSNFLPSLSLTRVNSYAGRLNIPAASGDYYAEVLNARDEYMTGYGEGGVTYFDGRVNEYRGDFYQSVDVYVNVNWAPPSPGVDGFWIDMTPFHADPANYGAEHNFNLRSTGSSVEVRADSTGPIATITTSGWYTFLISWKKDADPEAPANSDLIVMDAQQQVLGQATRTATSPGGPLKSKDLRGSGYLWFTVWQNGFANDRLGIDNLRTALLP